MRRAFFCLIAAACTLSCVTFICEGGAPAKAPSTKTRPDGVYACLVEDGGMDCKPIDQFLKALDQIETEIAADAGSDEDDSLDQLKPRSHDI